MTNPHQCLYLGYYSNLLKFASLENKFAASSSNSSPSTKPEGRNAQAQVQVQGMEMWRRLGVDTTILTLWTENLRVVCTFSLCVTNNINTLMLM